MFGFENSINVFFESGCENDGVNLDFSLCKFVMTLPLPEMTNISFNSEETIHEIY